MFTEVKKKLGFGCMRLPFKGDVVDYDEFNKMIDKFIADGFNYFDTARVYHRGMSEIALNKCLTSRYPRSAYLMADKLSPNLFKTEEEIEPVFMDQIKTIGCDYFDFYLIHCIQQNNYQHFKDCHAFEFGLRMKEKGLIKHLGFSFHDNAEMLDQILNDYPFVDFVQIQFNYADYDNPGVQSRACYDVCVKHNKPIVVMEPVRGGRLAKLPDELHAKFAALNNGTDASYAIRFCASQPQVFMTLSGMSNYEQLLDNVNYMKEFKPLTEEENKVVMEVADVLHTSKAIKCTGCRYCIDGCPMKIDIPEIFNIFNDYMTFTGIRISKRYNDLTANGGKCSTCVKCGKCEISCPQHLPIREYLADIAKEFDE